MKTRMLIIWTIFAITSGCSLFQNNSEPGGIPNPKVIDLTPVASELVTYSNHFGIDLFTKVATQEEGNMMISPLSANIALTMLLNGAQDNTLDEIRDMLGYPSNLSNNQINMAYKELVGKLLSADDKVTLAIANSLFQHKDFSVKTPYINVLKDAFNAEVKQVDMKSPATIDVINKWARDNTNNRIQKVIESLDRETVLILMNALYYKGNWTVQFNKNNTRNHTFYLTDGSTHEVPTMVGDLPVKASMMYVDEKPVHILELPYGRTNFSMVILMPAQPGLDLLHQELDSNLWAEVSAKLSQFESWTEREVRLPKFSFDYEIYLNEILMDLGMLDAFNPTTANFREISDSDIFVNFVKQNSFIEVNEEGTEAAAVTTIGMVVTSMPPSHVIDRPFVFAIRERTTNTIMFMGQVVDPKQ